MVRICDHTHTFIRKNLHYIHKERGKATIFVKHSSPISSWRTQLDPLTDPSPFNSLRRNNLCNSRKDQS